jgi:nitrate reductase NapE component
MMNTKAIQSQSQQVLQTALHLRVILFLVLLVGLYGFIGWRISSLADAEPGPAAIAAKESKASTPHIDQAVVDKVKQLEDNSVNVQTLFNEARQNPFRE